MRERERVIDFVGSVEGDSLRQPHLLLILLSSQKGRIVVSEEKQIPGIGLDVPLPLGPSSDSTQTLQCASALLKGERLLAFRFGIIKKIFSLGVKKN